MCSIAGIVGNGGDIKKMIKIQNHRAPDDSAFYVDKLIKIAMGRLKIIDLKSDGLCLYQEDGLVLSYNGEIYNYLELKKDLINLGVKFKTTSDTEVLLKSYLVWGLKALDKLNGMFAFAIYDKRKKILVMARDIAGEKPLYYYQRGKTFAFASEAKAFFDVLPISINDKNEFFESFEHCHITTLWREVKELPAAHYLIYDIQNNCIKSIKPYWQFKPRTINLKTAHEELEGLIEDAVKIRIRSDVPYALYFSGGIDSSLISTFHNFKYKFYFDSHHDWRKNFFSEINKIIWHLDFPVGSFSSYPLWKLAEMASAKVKVVISGEGADEIFGGYVRYLPVAQEYKLRNRFPSYNSYLFSKYFQFPNFLEAFSALTVRNNNKKSLEVVKNTIAPYFKMFDDPVNAMGFADFKHVFPSLLQMGDRMAGAFGIENRCPFLDKRIIEFGFSLPPEYKINNLEQKTILRTILKKRNMNTPLEQEKKGLTIFFNKWLNQKNIWDRSLYFDFIKKIWYKQYG